MYNLFIDILILCIIYSLIRHEFTRQNKTTLEIVPA